MDTPALSPEPKTDNHRDDLFRIMTGRALRVANDTISRKIKENIELRRELALKDEAISLLHDMLAEVEHENETQRQRIEDLTCARLSAGLPA